MFNALNLLAMLECHSDMFWSRSSFVTLFYLVSPRRCNHPVVQRNNQQGPRLRLLDRMVAAFDMTWYDPVRFIGSRFIAVFLVSLSFFSGIRTDWLCLIVWEDAVDAVDGCQVTKAIERQLEQSLGLSAVWLVRIYSHLSTMKQMVALSCCVYLMSKFLLTFDAAISRFRIRIASNKGTTITKRYHAAVNEVSGLFFSFVCVDCFLLLNVVVSSTTRCQNKAPEHFVCILLQCFRTYGYCVRLHGIADQLHEWCVDDHRVCCRALNAKMFDIDLAFWLLVCVASPKIHCKSWVKVTCSEHSMILQASAVSPVDPGPFGGVACWQGETMQDLEGFEIHQDSRCSTLWICWRCLNVVLMCSDQDQILFYLVSPRRCNHGVVQRNNQQGPRLRLLDRMVAAFDMTWYDPVRFIGSRFIAVFGAFSTCFSIFFLAFGLIDCAWLFEKML